MAKSSMKIKGLDSLEKELKRMQSNVAENSKKAEGQLSIDTGLILESLNSVNASFDTNFTSDSTNDDFINYFAERYQEIMTDGFFESDYDPIMKFNSKFNPYAKIEQ